jgi:hypothetical protein
MCATQLKGPAADNLCCRTEQHRRGWGWGCTNPHGLILSCGSRLSACQPCQPASTVQGATHQARGPAGDGQALCEGRTPDFSNKCLQQVSSRKIELDLASSSAPSAPATAQPTLLQLQCSPASSFRAPSWGCNQPWLGWSTAQHAVHDMTGLVWWTAQLLSGCQLSLLSHHRTHGQALHCDNRVGASFAVLGLTLPHGTDMSGGETWVLRLFFKSISRWPGQDWPLLLFHPAQHGCEIERDRV